MLRWFQNNSRFRRFTLVEVLAALVILALLFGLALPLFRKLTQSKNVDVVSRTLQTKMRACRAKAINEAERPGRMQFIDGIGLLAQVAEDKTTTPSRFYLYRCRPGRIVGGQWQFLSDANWTLLPNDVYVGSASSVAMVSSNPSYENTIVARGILLAFGGRGQAKQLCRAVQFSQNGPWSFDDAAGNPLTKPSDAGNNQKLEMKSKNKAEDVLTIDIRRNGIVKQK